MATYQPVTDGRPDGAQIGGSITEKIAFYGSTPVAQLASTSQAAVTTTITATAVLTQVAVTADAAVVLLNQIRGELVELGLIKGAA